MDNVKSIARGLLWALGAVLVSKGFVHQGDWDYIVSASVDVIVALAPIVTAIYWSWKKNQEPRELPPVVAPSE